MTLFFFPLLRWMNEWKLNEQTHCLGILDLLLEPLFLFILFYYFFVFLVAVVVKFTFCRGRQSFAVVGAAKLAPISGGNIRRIRTFWQWVITLSTQSAVTDLRSMKKLEYASWTLFWLALSKEGVWNQMLTPTFSRYSIKGLLARRNGRMGGMRSCASWNIPSTICHNRIHLTPVPHHCFLVIHDQTLLVQMK